MSEFLIAAGLAVLLIIVNLLALRHEMKQRARRFADCECRKIDHAEANARAEKALRAKSGV